MSTPDFIWLCIWWALGWTVGVGLIVWASCYFLITRPSNRAMAERTAAHRARMAQMDADAEVAKQRDLAEFDRFCDGVRADMDRHVAEAMRRHVR